MLSDDFFQGKLFSFAGFEFQHIEFGLLSGCGAFEFMNLGFSFLFVCLRFDCDYHFANKSRAFIFGNDFNIGL